MLAFDLFDSLQDECSVKVLSHPTTDCQDSKWSSVTLKFGNFNREIEVPMSKICHVNNAVSFDVNLTDTTTWMLKGSLKLQQNLVGTQHENIGKWWAIEKISVSCPGNKMANFGIGRPIMAGRTYDFGNFDTSLAENCPDSDQRSEELALNKMRYRRNDMYGVGLFGTQLNKEDLYEYELNKLGVVNPGTKAKILFFTYYKIFVESPKFSSLSEVLTFLSKAGLPPRIADSFWKEDDWFVAQRLQGINPEQIKNIQKIPSYMKVNSSKLTTIMGENLKDVMKSGRLFLAELDSLKDIKPYITPMALFYVDQSDKLKPLFIQYDQDSSENQRVYVNDLSNAWLMAKMVYNGLESIHHQVVAHFASTHYIAQQVSFLMYSFISPQHPIFKILKPHFYQMNGRNIDGINLLFSDGGIIDKLAIGGIAPARKLLKRTLENISYKRLNPALNNANRKTKTIKVYPYRDQGLPIYKTIVIYVREVLSNYYNSDFDVATDKELKDFRRRLAMPKELRGSSFKDLPGSDDDGTMTINGLVEMLSTFIYISTVQHAIVNDPQYDYFATIPNYPFIASIPDVPKNLVNEETIVSSLGNKLQGLVVVVTANTLSTDLGTNSLGDFERQLLQSPADLRAIDRFRKNLQILKQMKYASLNYPFPYLNIDKIKNSIAI